MANDWARLPKASDAFLESVESGIMPQIAVEIEFTVESAI
jgi:hypothetical protein